MLTLLLPLIAAAPPAPATPAADVYAFSYRDLDGKTVPMSRFRGKAILIVNTASLCGNTPQYAGLENLYRKYTKRGLVVLGFPANDFNSQEPGTNADIKTFCSTKYGVTFPMAGKVVVRGENRIPLFSWLIAKSGRPNDEVEWNFTKFLVSRDGKRVERFLTKVTPDSTELASAVERNLG